MHLRIKIQAALLVAGCVAAGLFILSLPSDSEIGLRSAKNTELSPEPVDRREIIIKRAEAVASLERLSRLADSSPIEERTTQEQDDPTLPETAELHLKVKFKEKFFELAPDYLEEIIEWEEKDGAWRDSIAGQIENSLAESEWTSAELESVECSRTVCRVSFVHEDMEALHEFTESPVAEGSWRQEAGDSIERHEELPSSEVISHIYVTRRDDQQTFIDIKKDIAASYPDDSGAQVDDEEAPAVDLP